MSLKIHKQKVSSITQKIRTHWKKSIDSLIEVGKNLHELKKILERKDYLNHLKKEFSMNEMSAHRIENLYLNFHDKKTKHVLSSKPSVLYLITSTIEMKKIESLARGGKILIGTKYKTLPELTIDDIYNVKKASNRTKEAFDVDENERDLERAKNAHRRLSSFVEEINDWSRDLIRFKKQNIKIENKELVKNYVEETIECLKELQEILS